MNDRYLWDRSGPPDPDVEEFEKMLAPLRYRHRAELVNQPRLRPRVMWAAAAAALLTAVAVWQVGIRPSRNTGWQVASLDGAARLGSSRATVAMRIRPGQTLRTGSDTQLMLEADKIGRVDLGPDSEMHAVTGNRLLLNRGTLHAFIWAPPREFVVDTPSARAIDLGCDYTITVDPSGNGLLRVAMGWVAFQSGGLESFIPEGAACKTRQKEGPGLPYFEDSTPAFQRAVAGYESGAGAGELEEILRSARPRDGLTLWHLLTRVPDAERPAVFDRFAQLVELPDEVKREAVLRKDPRMIDLCWNALSLENTSWWRGWERKW